MKRLFTLPALLLLLCLILTACVSPVPDPLPSEPVEYHVTEVKKTWGDDKFNAIKCGISTKYIEEHIEPLKFELNDGGKVSLIYQYTKNDSRFYKFEVEKFSIECGIFVDTGNLSYLEISGGNQNDFDYKSFLRDCESDSDAISVIKTLAVMIGISDIESYECEMMTSYRGGIDGGFFGFEHEGKEWLSSTFHFEKPYAIGDVVFNKKVFIDMRDDGFTISVTRELIDTATTKVSIAEIKSAVDAFVCDNFDPQFPVTEVRIDDHMLSFIRYDGRLCCVINEFFINFTNTRDGKPFDDHIHCGAIVFLE